MPLPDTPATSTFMGDVVYERAEALKAAVIAARETLCGSLDGDERSDPVLDADVVPMLDREWRKFRAVVAEAQRIEGRE